MYRHIICILSFYAVCVCIHLQDYKLHSGDIKHVQVCNISEAIHGSNLRNKVHHERNQPNKSNVLPYKPLVSLKGQF